MNAPTRDEIGVALKAARLSQSETGQPSAEAALNEFHAWAVAEENGDKLTAPADALLKQFQAWAAEEDARAQAEPVPPVKLVQPVQDAPAPVVQNDREQVQPTPRRRQARPARAEIRPARNPRAKARREQNARVQISADASRASPARTGCASPGRDRRKCPGAVVPAKPRFAQLGTASQIPRIRPR